MHEVGKLMALTCFLVITPMGLGLQHAEPWLPITPEDQQIQSAPFTPGAPAIQLYYSYLRDDSGRFGKFISVYRKIKILTEAGKKYGDVEIPLDPGDALKELKARTIQPNGAIVEFTDKPFTKTIFKGRGVRYIAMTFALPAVAKNSIVEYSYLVTKPRLRALSEWQLQSDLYTLKERFRFTPSQVYVDVPTEWNQSFRQSQVMCSYKTLPGMPAAQKKKDGSMELELDHVPAFDSEESMPPESDYRPFVMCYYGGRELASADTFWPEWQKRLAQFAQQWIGNPSALRDAAAQATAGETDPEKKLRKLYARVQQIRNISYEPDRTEQEEKREKINFSKSAQEVLQHAYGTRWEIDALFVGLAQAAGFDASLLAVADRHERSFSKLILWLGQLDGVAAMVKLNGNDIVLDPGTRFCPYGSLDWRYSAATALVFKAGAGFITTPEPRSSAIRRTVDVTVSPEGSAKGTISVELRGPEALMHRLEALRTDEAGRRKSFEDEVQSWLPSGAQVQMEDSQGWESTDEPLIAKFKVSLTNFGAATGKRLVFPAYALPPAMKRVFSPDTRAYPIDLPYGLAESDQVTIHLPTGYAPEATPSPRKAGLSYADYEVTSSVTNGALVTSRSLRLDGHEFPPEKYFELKNFFTVVQGGDSAQAVLQVGERP